jgi:hypothetical protein
VVLRARLFAALCGVTPPTFLPIIYKILTI